jgi:hypothetical protein
MLELADAAGISPADTMQILANALKEEGVTQLLAFKEDGFRICITCCKCLFPGEYRWNEYFSIDVYAYQNKGIATKCSTDLADLDPAVIERVRAIREALSCNSCSGERLRI